MGDLVKPHAETADRWSTQEENAVGYREYVEGLDLEVSDREVGLYHLFYLPDSR